MNFQLGPMLHRRNNDAAVPGEDAAVPGERQEERLGNRQATNSHRIVNGQPFGIGGKKGKLLLARSLPGIGAGVQSVVESDRHLGLRLFGRDLRMPLGRAWALLDELIGQTRPFLEREGVV
jgi:hypothetical protein